MIFDAHFMKTSNSKLLCSSQTSLEHFDHTIFYGNIKWQEGDISQFRHIPLNAMHKLLFVNISFQDFVIFSEELNEEKTHFQGQIQYKISFTPTIMHLLFVPLFCEIFSWCLDVCT